MGRSQDMATAVFSTGFTLEKYQVCRTRIPEPLLRSTRLTSNGAPMTANVSSLFRFLRRIEYSLSIVVLFLSIPLLNLLSSRGTFLDTICNVGHLTEIVVLSRTL
ncbi:hypothetical protein M378DRAFT_928476 [Amanita muscaria Koide BX008]|uniref:Uncharacterized protein n=1 Tax=Amanita muscaria (strain Koide BX008) TaxID=946122 RepID=A0A0C2XF71_AMAMK|nr:hypothetical protein M378DRAFT_928476 [Amanita muscaria Koide BX008]